jgi:diadenylate cyclase
VDVVSYFSSVWLQILEIVLVATFFYYILLAVRGTKASVAFGIIIMLGIIYFACEYFQLITLKFVLEKILLFGPLVVLIIFAPEIRKVLEQATKRSELVEWIFPSEERSKPGTALDTIYDAVTDLSERKVGALFILEGKENIDEHIVPGTELQAVPTARFIASLLEKHNPLHDGAVLIRDERIWSAGNFLPISESSFLGQDLGTRHRAAVGLSERCDAVIAVVSEERGEVSLAYHGRLARWLSDEQFREQLSALVDTNENFSTIVPRGAYI